MTIRQNPRATRSVAGKVYLVGAGPGAPDLLTLRAAETLRRADVVFHDALVHPEVLALAARAERVAVGKRCGRFATAQQFINKRLVDAARKHAVVVRLKGGDPMLFGRAQEELATLESAGIPCEVVPGVTSALAAAAEAGISLTQRGVARSVAFVTPRVGEGEAPSEWARTVAAADTAVIYMGAGQAAQITAALLVAGVRPEVPVLVAESVTLPQTRRIALTLRELPRIAQYGITGPTLILLGGAFGTALSKGVDNTSLYHATA
ncbi:MAG: uroporphyrinogen-III C-methyltransferase [Betaproteobacteria bacterium]|nr:uroporphyrinogen-III C-methyltransferase [Betaproteobacteria bacterium]MDH3436559.1 uroporphyrinogen-III C-methyltransferase [Betaproteobacteria bacterium]